MARKIYELVWTEKKDCRCRKNWKSLGLIDLEKGKEVDFIMPMRKKNPDKLYRLKTP